MTEKGIIYFHLGTFVHPSTDKKDIEVLPKPESPDESSVFQYIQKVLPEGITVESLFNSIIDDHKARPNLYLEPREVTIIPKLEPENAIERLQYAKNMLATVIEPEQIHAATVCKFDLGINSLKPWQKYVLSVAIRHAYLLSSSEIFYSTRKTEFMNAFFACFTPKTPFPVIRFIADGEFKSDKLSTHATLRVNSINEMTINGKTAKYNQNQAINSTALKFDNGIFHAKSSLTIPSLRKSILGENNPIQAAITTVEAGASIKELGEVLSCLDERFIETLYNSIKSEAEHKTVFNSLLSIFSSVGKQLQLMKFLAYFELSRSTDTNTIFRGNSNAIRSLLAFMNTVGENYLFNEVVPSVYKFIASKGKWNMEKPSAECLAIAREELNFLFKTLKDSVPKIPNPIRQLLRYVRLLSERHYCEPQIIHRCVFALFILRFYLPALTGAPDELVQSDPMGRAKVIQLSKLAAKVCQLLPGSNDNQGITDLVNEFSIEAIQLYDLICKPDTPEKLEIELSDSSANPFREYVLSHKEALIENASQNSYPGVFVDDFISEFLVRSQ